MTSPENDKFFSKGWFRGMATALIAALIIWGVQQALLPRAALEVKVRAGDITWPKSLVSEVDQFVVSTRKYITRKESISDRVAIELRSALLAEGKTTEQIENGYSDIFEMFGDLSDTSGESGIPDAVKLREYSNELGFRNYTSLPISQTYLRIDIENRGSRPATNCKLTVDGMCYAEVWREGGGGQSIVWGEVLDLGRIDAKESVVIYGYSSSRFTAYDKAKLVSGEGVATVVRYGEVPHWLYWCYELWPATLFTIIVLVGLSVWIAAVYLESNGAAGSGSGEVESICESDVPVSGVESDGLQNGENESKSG